MKLLKIAPVLPLMLLAGVLNTIANILYKVVILISNASNEYVDYLERNETEWENINT